MRHDIQTVSPSALARLARESRACVDVSRACTHLARKLCILATDPGASRATLASRNAIVVVVRERRAVSRAKASPCTFPSGYGIVCDISLCVWPLSSWTCGRDCHLDTRTSCTVCVAAIHRVTGSSWYRRVCSPVWHSRGLAPCPLDRRMPTTRPTAFDDAAADDDVASMRGARGDARDGRCARVFERRARDVFIRDSDDDSRDTG